MYGYRTIQIHCLRIGLDEFVPFFKPMVAMILDVVHVQFGFLRDLSVCNDGSLRSWNQEPGPIPVPQCTDRPAEGTPSGSFCGYSETSDLFQLRMVLSGEGVSWHSLATLPWCWDFRIPNVEAEFKRLASMCREYRCGTGGFLVFLMIVQLMTCFRWHRCWFLVFVTAWS